MSGRSEQYATFHQPGAASSIERWQLPAHAPPPMPPGAMMRMRSELVLALASRAGAGGR